MSEEKSLGQIGWETCFSILSGKLPDLLQVKWENLDDLQHDAWNEAASAIVEHNRRRNPHTIALVCDTKPVQDLIDHHLEVLKRAEAYDKPIHRPPPVFEEAASAIVEHNRRRVASIPTQKQLSAVEVDKVIGIETFATFEAYDKPIHRPVS